MSEKKAKIRNHYLDFWKAFFSIFVAILHYQRLFIVNAIPLFDTGYLAYADIIVSPDGFFLAGTATLGFFTFTTGYWLMDYYKKNQKNLGKGKDLRILWNYWAKNYAAYMPYMFAAGIVTFATVGILYKAPILDWLHWMLYQINQLIGLGELGFTNQNQWRTIAMNLAWDPTFTVSFQAPFTTLSLGGQFWYMSCLIIFGAGLLATLITNEKISLFVLGPVFLYLLINYGYGFILVNDSNTGDIIRLFGPAYLGIYGWYAIDAIRKAASDPKVKKIVTCLHALALIILFSWILFWHSATLFQSNMISCFVAFFAVLNVDYISEAMNRFFARIPFISKHMAMFGLGIFLYHFFVMDVFSFQQHNGLWPWFSAMSHSVQCLTILGACAVVSLIFIIVIEPFVCRPMAKVITDVSGCRKPIVFEETK